MKLLRKYSLLAGLFVFFTSAFHTNPAIGATAQINGNELFYEVFNSPTPNPHYYPILLLHGGLADNESWIAKQYGIDLKGLIPVDGFQVIALESRGHGRSRGELGPITYQLMADDVAYFINYLKYQGIIAFNDKINIMGWSDGGVIALNMCKTFPGLVNAALTIGTNIAAEGFSDDPYITGNAFLDWLLNGLGFSDLMSSPFLYNPWADFFFSPAWISQKNVVDPGFSNAYWLNRFKAFRSTLYNVWNTSCYIPKGPNETCMEALQDIETPIFVLAGENEETLKISHVEEIYDNLIQNSPTSQLYIFPNAGHALPWEYPNAVAMIACDWFGIANPK